MSDRFPQRKRLPHFVPEWVQEGSFFFLTFNCLPRGQNHLCRSPVGESVLEAAAFYHQRFQWHCRLMVLMPDHSHAILSVPRNPGLKATVQNWRKFLARTQRLVWQRDFFDHRLRDHHECQEKESYVLMNPVRRELCQRVEEWPWVYRPQDRLPTRWG